MSTQISLICTFYVLHFYSVIFVFCISFQLAAFASFVIVSLISIFLPRSLSKHTDRHRHTQAAFIILLRPAYLKIEENCSVSFLAVILFLSLNVLCAARVQPLYRPLTPLLLHYYFCCFCCTYSCEYLSNYFNLSTIADDIFRTLEKWRIGKLQSFYKTLFQALISIKLFLKHSSPLFNNGIYHCRFR